MPFDGPKRVLTEEFKREAVRLAKERGNVEEAARDLGIHSTILHRWKRRLATAPSHEVVFPGHGNPKDPELVHRVCFDNRHDARSAVFAWIEIWYNRKRRPSALGYLSPEQFQRQQVPRAA